MKSILRATFPNFELHNLKGLEMRRAILMMLLTVASSSAMAGWVKVITDANFDHYSPCVKDCDFIYVDIANISKTGDTVKVWRMNDFSKPEPLINRWLPPSKSNSKPHLSVKIQDEYNCKEQQIRSVFSSYHSGHMGGGQTVFIDNAPGKWTSIGGLSPDVPVKLLWRAVCEKQ